MKPRLLATVAAALLLAGCGPVHPGAAAVVDDTAIPMGQADDVAGIYCRLALLNAPQGAPLSSADVRRQAVSDLVVGVVARQMAEEANVTPNPADYEVTPDQRRQIAQTFADDEVDDAVDVINSSQRNLAIAELLAAKEAGDRDADPDRLRQRGIRLIQAEIGRRDVRFDPRFGISRDGRQEAATGSLSVPVEAPDPSAQEGLPATQQCSR